MNVDRRRFKFSMRAMLLVVLICSVVFALFINWQPLIRRVQYPPINWDRVSGPIIYDGSVLIMIDGNRYVGYSSTLRQQLVNFRPTKNPSRLREVGQIWRTQTTPPMFEVEVCGELIELIDIQALIPPSRSHLDARQ